MTCCCGSPVLASVQAQGGGDGQGHEDRVLHGVQGYEAGAVGINGLQKGCRLQRQPGLTHAGRAEQRHQAPVVSQHPFAHPIDIAGPTDQQCGRRRQAVIFRGQKM